MELHYKIGDKSLLGINDVLYHFDKTIKGSKVYDERFPYNCFVVISTGSGGLQALKDKVTSQIVYNSFLDISLIEPRIEKRSGFPISSFELTFFVQWVNGEINTYRYELDREVYLPKEETKFPLTLEFKDAETRDKVLNIFKNVGCETT